MYAHIYLYIYIYIYPYALLHKRIQFHDAIKPQVQP